MSVFKIGEIAAELGISTDTIRLYEKQGIIEKPLRSANGYRLYSESAIPVLKFIIKAKGMGFTLNEIKELLEIKYTSDNTCEDVRKKVKLKLLDVENRLAELNKLRRALMDLTATCDKRKGDACPILDVLEKQECEDTRK